MVSSTLNHQQPKRDITIVMGIALVALVGILFSCVLDVVSQLEYLKYGFWDGVKSFFGSAIVAVVDLVPVALLMLYIFRYHKNAEQSPLPAVIYGVIAVRPLLANFVWGILVYREGIRYVLRCIFFGNNIIHIVAFALAALSLIVHFAERIVPVLATIAELVFNFNLDFLRNITYFFEQGGLWSPLWTIMGVLWAVGRLALFAALLVIIFQNSKPKAAVAAQGAVATQGAMKNEVLSVEQALKNLKEKHDSGMITDEEYQAKRQEIISKL